MRCGEYLHIDRRAVRIPPVACDAGDNLTGRAGKMTSAAGRKMILRDTTRDITCDPARGSVRRGAARRDALRTHSQAHALATKSSRSRCTAPRVAPHSALRRARAL